ncbi:hypothetical protein F5B20DRAFT_165460 [Whalleya microplaca]|nr:hypothetical protein F5B20DRAFT_165460 [Whalleya microplaca]
MSNDNGARKWRIEVVSPNDEGCCFYLSHYKPFRLAALLEDPEAFGSTYAREVDFTDDDWVARLKNPLAKTFVAVRTHDGRVLSATSLIGPLLDSIPASNPTQVVKEMRNGGDQQQSHEISPIPFQITGVYTRPEARGQGLGKALAKAATEHALRQANEKGRALRLSVVVYKSNRAAISFYESCGFVAGPEGGRAVFNPLKNFSAEEICMYYHHGSHGQDGSPDRLSK